MPQVGAASGYSQQFSQFVSFAEDSKTTETSIARFDDTGLNGRTINAADKDGIGGLAALFRSKTNREANNVARDKFRTSVLAMFHNDMSLVPPNVRKAMQLSDYGSGDHSTSGKPLTARRILAVRQAVDTAKAEIDAAVQEVKAGISEMYSGADDQTKADLDNLVEMAVMCCGGDKEAIDILKVTIKSIIRRGDADLRSVDDVKGKVDGIMANLQELRALAKNMPAVYEAAKQMLVKLEGKSFPPGMLKQIFNTAGKYDVSGLKTLSPSASGPVVHRFITAFQALTEKALSIPGMEKMSLESNARGAFSDFVGALLIAKCGSSAVTKMKEAFSSEKMSKIVRFYNDVKVSGYTLQVSAVVDQQMRDNAGSIIDALTKINALVERQCGIDEQEGQELPEYPTLLTNEILEEFDGGVTLGIMIDEAEKALQAKQDRYLTEVLQGNSKGINLMRGVYARKVDGLYDPKGFIVSCTQKGIKERLQQAVNACTAESQAPEIHKLDVRLPDGKRLSDTFEKARDELVQFVSGQADATFEAADEPTKNKVRIVMTLLGRASEACFDGYAVGLDPQNSQKMVDMGDKRKVSYELFFAGENMVLTFGGSCDITGIRTEKGNVPVTGLSLTTGFSITLTPNTFSSIIARQFPAPGAKADSVYTGLYNCSVKPSFSVTDADA